MNEQEQTKTHRPPHGGYQRAGGGGVVTGKGVKYMVTEDGLPLGGEHTIQCTDDVS